MIEFEPILEYYASIGYSMYSTTIKESNWGDRMPAERYLGKYWLRESEYRKEWKPFQDDIFSVGASPLFEPTFKPRFEVITRVGGCLFVEDEFQRLQRCVQSIGERYLIVIENPSEPQMQTKPSFRLKYPADISWEELNSGGYMSSILIEMPHNEYFVFGDSARWGKYAANDHPWPLDKIGFEPEQSTIFRQMFDASGGEKGSA